MIIVLIVIVSLLSGCWDRKELRNVSVVTGMAVDVGDHQKYKLTVETTAASEVNPRSAEGYAPANVQALEGNTIAELTHKFNIISEQSLILSHMRVLVISEEVAEKGMMEFMDFMDRNREIRDDFDIVIARDSKAASVLKTNNMYKKSASLKIFTQLVSMYNDWGGVPKLRLNDFIRIYKSDGQTPVLVALKVKGDPKKGGNIENMKTVTPENKVDVDSLAIIKGGKLVGYISIYDVRNMLFVQNNLKSTIITAKCGNGAKSMGYRVTASKTNVIATEEDGVPSFTINVKTEGNLQNNECLTNMSKIYAFKGYEDIINKKMERAILDTVNRTREQYNADIFGLGERLKDQDYKQFKKYRDNWDEGFSKAKINIRFNTEIKQAGLRKERAFIK
ncbi:Ger(x)C family spore germination protein [Niallia circulans]|uniref:Ger(X)C family spore germination protein n=2 Tax=Niallia circulans TaxID=1397 RepID=A0A553SS85_NIACI|nr:Ger(x)C family spore germination protein [Niallia circulans]